MVTQRATDLVSPEPPPVVFRADRLFLFAILENSTHTVLFLGRLETPATP